MLAEVHRRRQHTREEKMATIRYVEQAVIAANKSAMKQLAEGNSGESLKCLKEAKSLLMDPEVAALMEGSYQWEWSHLMVMTLNNHACFSKQSGNLDDAMESLETALHYSSNDSQQLTVTYSNLSVVLSEKGRHSEAAKHAKLAMEHCERRLEGLLDDKEFSKVEQLKKQTSALAIACYNYAVQLEHVKGEYCIQWYERAYCLALKSSTNAQLMQQLLDSFTNATKDWCPQMTEDLGLEDIESNILHEGDYNPRKSSKGKVGGNMRGSWEYEGELDTRRTSSRPGSKGRQGKNPFQQLEMVYAPENTVLVPGRSETNRKSNTKKIKQAPKRTGTNAADYLRGLSQKYSYQIEERTEPGRDFYPQRNLPLRAMSPNSAEALEKTLAELTAEFKGLGIKTPRPWGRSAVMKGC